METLDGVATATIFSLINNLHDSDAKNWSAIEQLKESIGVKLTPHWIVSVVLATGILFFFGFFISLVRGKPVQRTWVLTLFPFTMMTYILMMDGSFFKDGGLEVTKTIGMLCIISSVMWNITNLIDKKVGVLSIKKGDFEAKIDNSNNANAGKETPSPDEKGHAYERRAGDRERRDLRNREDSQSEGTTED